MWVEWKERQIKRHFKCNLMMPQALEAYRRRVCDFQPQTEGRSSQTASPEKALSPLRCIKSNEELGPEGCLVPKILLLRFASSSLWFCSHCLEWESSLPPHSLGLAMTTYFQGPAQGSPPPGRFATEPFHTRSSTLQALLCHRLPVCASCWALTPSG